MPALLLFLWFGTSDAKRVFDEKCLYCHSSRVIEQKRLKPAQWRQLVGKMRSRAPLLISRTDADTVVRYIVRELHLVPPHVAAAKPESPAQPEPVEPDEPEPEPAPEPPPAQPRQAQPAPVVVAPPVEEIDTEAETLGPQLLAARCSKCHTLFRVYTKIDSATAGDATIDRMRRKTGSGISARDANILKRFLRSRAP